MLYGVPDMKPIIVLLILLGSCVTATAQTTACRSITSDSERLACYDKAAGGGAANGKSGEIATPAKPAVQPQPASSTSNTIDLLAIENRKLENKLKNICRGC